MYIATINLSKIIRSIAFTLIICISSVSTYASNEGDLDDKKPVKSNKSGENARKAAEKALRVNAAILQFGDLSYEAIEEEFAATQASQSVRDSAKKTLDAINTANTWVSVITDNASVQLPFGVKKKIGGSEYQVGIANIDFTGAGTFARAFARIILPQRDANGNKKELYFAGTVELTRVGGIVSDGKLALIGNDAIKSSGDWSLSLKGNEGSTQGKIDDQTYFKFDCSGFVEVGIKGEVLLAKDVYIPVSNKILPLTDPNLRCSAPVNLVAKSFDDLIIPKLQFSNPITLKKGLGYLGYGLLIKEATLDLSDTKNAEKAPTEFGPYLKTVQPSEPNTWVGIVVNSLQVYLPGEFKLKNSSDGLTVLTPYAVIDATGFSTKVDAKNIMTLAQGSAGNWPFSVDELSITIKSSAFEGGSLAGNIVLPIQTKTGGDKLSYKGKINTDGDYSIQVSFTNGIKADFWKCTLDLDKSSSLTLSKINGQFLPKAVLTGKLSFGTDGGKDEKVSDTKSDKKKMFSCENITFEELTLQTVKPYFNVKAMGAAGKLHLASFEAEFNVKVTKGTPPSGSSAETIAMKFGIDMKLMDGKIGGKTDFTVNAIYNEAQAEWQYKNIDVSKIGVTADFGKTKFAGEVTILKNDPTFGNGLAGDFTLNVDKFEIKGKGIFGVKNDFRYFSVDGSIDGLEIKAGKITFTGFSGGISYKMKTSNKDSKLFPSGILYEPDNNAFLRVRAGTMFYVVEKKILTADAGFEIVFNSNWGVNQVLINGNFKMYTEDQNTNGAATMAANLKAFSSSTPTAPQQNGAKIWGKVLINLDFQNDTYSGTLDVFVNDKNKLFGDQGNSKAGTASFFVGGDKWNVNIGTKETPVKLRYKEGVFNLGGSAYFQTGNDLKTFVGDAGFAIKFGFGINYDLDYKETPFYAKVDGGVQIDIQIAHIPGVMCDGERAGLDGWVGDGNLKAWLNASCGMYFEGVGQAEVFNASISAELYVKGPKPLYFKGIFRGRWSINLGKLKLSDDFKIDFEKGKNCNFTTDAEIFKTQAKIQTVAADILKQTTTVADSIRSEQAKASVLEAMDLAKKTAAEAEKRAADLKKAQAETKAIQDALMAEIKRLADEKAKADAAALKKAQDEMKAKADVLAAETNRLAAEKAAALKKAQDEMKAKADALAAETNRLAAEKAAALKKAQDEMKAKADALAAETNRLAAEKEAKLQKERDKIKNNAGNLPCLLFNQNCK